MSRSYGNGPAPARWRSPGRSFSRVCASLVFVILASSAATASENAVDEAAGDKAISHEEADQQTAAEAPTEAAGPKESPEKPEPILFERVRVVGSPDQIDKIPGSVTYLDEERLARHDYADVHRILSQVPGVNIQEEEGYGLRPNIGMRGSGVERSSKITTLEDGVLIAPAPYSAPSAYYFPTAGRMEGVEVRKGSSAIRHGPFTTGGVLNFISSSIPSSFGGSLNLALGGNDTLRGRLKIGDSRERFGWLVETYQFDTEGFKELDGGGETGVDLEDYLVKLRLNSSPRARVFQALELKAGRTEQFGNETYLGLTQEDFDRNPFRRYAGSQEDNIDTDHEQIQVRYLLRPNDKIDFTATVYRNDFFRNWHKLQSVGGTKISTVLGDPEAFATELAILRADLAADSTDDALRVRNNRRDYYSQGSQVIVGIKPAGTGSTHEIEVGVRYHEDQEDRFQEEDGFRMTVGGEMVLTSLGAPGSQANRVSSAQALALFVQDSISKGKWSIVPGVRFETIDFERVDYDDAQRTIIGGIRKNSIDEVIPGVGVSYELNETSTLFGGVHRGFSPPGPSATDADVEESINYEFGYRRHGGPLSTELVGFFNDYDNLLGACTVSSGCSNAEIGDVFDGGEVEVYGLEAGLRYDFGKAHNAGLSIPLDLTYTYTTGEFQNSFESDFDPWGDVVVGDELPYLPEHQASLGLGLVHSSWSAFTNLVYVGAMRTVAGQGSIPQNESTDAHLLVDLSANYHVRSNLKLYLQVRNLTDKEYVAARRPAGARPGISRTAFGGISVTF